MKISALDTYMLSVSLAEPVRTSTSTISRVSELIVRLTTDAGLVGIGEAHGPFLSQAGPEGMRAVAQILERVTPLVVGKDPFGVERIWQDLFALTYTSVRGIPTLAQQRRQLVTAMSAIDIALWDLMGKATGRPVHALLGGGSATASLPTSPASTTATASVPTTCAEKRRSISSTVIAL